jgi:glutamine amidotransferase
VCRFAAYLGPSARLSTLLYDPPRSLEVQAYAPREQLHGSVNVDGTGVAWWDDPAERVPLRYVSERSPWSDPNLPALAPRLRAGVQLAAVRSATPGMPFSAGAVAPFLAGRLAGVHNGRIGAFRERTCGPLLARLPGRLVGGVGALSDSVVLFLHVVTAFERDPDAGLAAAVRAGVAEVARVCAEHDAAATLTVAVADGERVVALRAAVGSPANSLYTLRGGGRWPDAVLLASEPLDDDPAWRPVPVGCVVELTSEGVATVAVPELKDAA